MYLFNISIRNEFYYALDNINIILYIYIYI